MVPAGLFAPSHRIQIAGSSTLEIRLLAAIELAIDVRVEDGERPERIRYYQLRSGAPLTALPAGGTKGTFVWPLNGRVGLVQSTGYAPAIFEIEEPTGVDSVSVTLRPGGRIKVILRSAPGEPLGGHPFRIEPLEGTVLHDFLRDQTTFSRGTRTLDLAPGTYRVKTTLPSGEELTADVTLSAGETRELTLP